VPLQHFPAGLFRTFGIDMGELLNNVNTAELNTLEILSPFGALWLVQPEGLFIS
jgi:hypothetical protein